MCINIYTNIYSDILLITELFELRLPIFFLFSSLLLINNLISSVFWVLLLLFLQPVTEVCPVCCCQDN